MANKKMEGFSGLKEIYWTVVSPHRKQNLIQEGTNMKMGRKINRVRCDIQSHIIAAGYTQKEAVEAFPPSMDGVTAIPIFPPS